MIIADIILPYAPRTVFLPYHESDKRMAISVCHRRAGKTVARINKIIRAALTCTNYRPKFAYLAPTQSHAKDIAWAYIKQYAAPLFEYGAKTNEVDLSLILPFNRAEIRLYGAHNADRMRGNYFDGVVVDEGQDISRKVLSEIIFPTLVDRKGWLDVSGTPKGWTNVLGEIYKEAQNQPHYWFTQILRASESGLIDAEELDRARSFMSENEYEQEFECSFDAAITGSVYGDYIAKAAKEGRLNHDIKPASKIYTSWDLGWGDATAIWWWQMVGDEIHILDYYENSGHDMTHYAKVVLERGKKYMYNYQEHYAPHDVGNKYLASGGKSVYDRALACGVKFTRIPATSQANQIEAARITLDRCWFDSKCDAEGLAALRNYHFKTDDKKQTQQPEPYHDWSSHACDAFEIIAQVWHIVRKAQEKPKKPVFWENVPIDKLMR